jgi:hypothetical protein
VTHGRGLRELCHPASACIHVLVEKRTNARVCTCAGTAAAICQGTTRPRREHDTVGEKWAKGGG